MRTVKSRERRSCKLVENCQNVNFMMEAKFVHSIKVPNQYKNAAKLLKKTFETGQSVKGQIFQLKHVRTNRLYALIGKISKYKSKLDILIERSSILLNETRLDKYLCMVLMTELLFGAEKLNGESKPVLAVLGYESKFRQILTDLNNDPANNIEPLQDVVKPRYVRVNTNLISRTDAIELFVKDGWKEIVEEFTAYDKFLEVVRNLGHFDFVSDMHVKNLFVFPSSSKAYWAKHALTNERKFILQDKASCLPVTLLDPSRGSVVLDMCAAPGMKTTHLAAMIRNKGKIYAVERDEKRYETLTTFIAETKSSCVNSILQDALTLENIHTPNVEYILVDPSCSGSGMTNRLFVSAIKDANRLANLTGLQSRMLSHAMREFTKAKKIVYSTCSIHVEENEKVVQECLQMCPDWELIKPISFAEQWKHFGSPKFKHIGKKCIYAKPEIDLTDGFFVAIFERKKDDGNGIHEEGINWYPKQNYSSETAIVKSKESNDVKETVILEDFNTNEKRKKKKRKLLDESTSNLYQNPFDNDVSVNGAEGNEGKNVTEDVNCTKKAKKKKKYRQSDAGADTIGEKDSGNLMEK